MDKALYCRIGQFEIIRLRNKPFMYKEHNHVSVYTIGLVLRGTVTLKCEGEQKLYHAGSFFIVPPYKIHTLSLPDVYDMLSICVDKDMLGVYEIHTFFSQLSEALAQISVYADNELLLKAVDAMYRCDLPCPINGVILSSALSIRLSPEKVAGVQSLADRACYSMYHYIKVFKKQMGMTPHKFQMQNRVRKAQAMVGQGAMSAGIALELGFYDQSHFIKNFKNIVGFTPAEYSRAIRHI